MVQLGETERFFSKAPAGGFVSNGPWRQNLQRNVAIQLFVMRAIDNAHSAGTELFKNAVVPEHLTDHGKSRLGRHLRPRTRAKSTHLKRKMLTSPKFTRIRSAQMTIRLTFKKIPWAFRVTAA